MGFKNNNQILLRTAAALAMAVLAASAWAQQGAGEYHLDVDKLEVEVGDTLNLTTAFKQTGSANLNLTGQPAIPTPEHFQIQGQSSSQQIFMMNQQSGLIFSTQFTLVATKPGEETLGPAVLTYQDASGKNRQMQSNTVTVKVVEKSPFSIFRKKKAENPPEQNPQPNPDDLRGLKPLMPEDESWLRYVIWPLVFLAIAGFVWWQFRKTNQPGAPPPLPAGTEAQLRDRWKKLGNDDLDPKEFCLGLSGLVRECLQYRYGFPAVNYTTEQILKEMASRKASDDEKAALEKCLKTCDRVLHADGNLTGRDNLRALASALLPKIQRS